MKYYFLIAVLSVAFFSCKKEGETSDTQLHAIEYNESKNIVGEYRGLFSWSANDKESIRQQADQNLQGTFTIKYTGKNSLEITSDISTDLRYTIYEMKMAKIALVDDHLEYYFTGKAKDCAENTNSFAEMSLKTYKKKNVFSLYSCNTFDGMNGEILHVFDATLDK